MNKTNVIVIAIAVFVLVVGAGVGAWIFMKPERLAPEEVILRLEEATPDVTPPVEEPVVPDVALPPAEEVVEERPVLVTPVVPVAPRGAREISFTPDRTIPAELCRRVITRSQVLEIMGGEMMGQVPLREKVNREGFVFLESLNEVQFVHAVPVNTCYILPPGSPEDIGRAFRRAWGWEGERVPKLKIIFYPRDTRFDFVVKYIGAGIETRELQDIGDRAVSLSKDFVFVKQHTIIFLDPDINQIMSVSGTNVSLESVKALARQVEKNLR